MKYFVLFCALAAVSAAGFQNCADAPRPLQITAEQLKANEGRINEILDNDFCENDDQCKVLPFGSKACGGPREFLVHSSIANFSELEELVLEYNQYEQQHNISTGAISTCDIAVAPSLLKCENNKCIGN